ncbi:MAG: hypothetical protein SPG34_01150, partial [Trueperella sp.]|uniref:hypothetical protein n=1 Tax=Trueperella sp. TaxID=2699835 RepID=UPI002A90F2D9
AWAPGLSLPAGRLTAATRWSAHLPTLLLNIPTADRYTGLVGLRFLSYVGPEAGAPPNIQPAQAYPDTSLEDLAHLPTLLLNIPTADRYTGLVGLRFLSYVGPRPGEG